MPGLCIDKLIMVSVRNIRPSIRFNHHYSIRGIYTASPVCSFICVQNKVVCSNYGLFYVSGARTRRCPACVWLFSLRHTAITGMPIDMRSKVAYCTAMSLLAQDVLYHSSPKLITAMFDDVTDCNVWCVVVVYVCGWGVVCCVLRCACVRVGGMVVIVLGGV